MLERVASRAVPGVGALVLAMAVGGGASVQPAAGLALSPGQAAVHLPACAAGSVPERDALSDAGASLLCRPASRPESSADLAARGAQVRARESAPFASVSSGAFRAALTQKLAVAPAGSLPGSGGTWSPAGASPLCDGHTTQSNLCPLADNTSLTLSNGDYTISILGHKTLSGRITAFAADVNNPNRVFAAPSNSGVFETTNGGTTWRSVGDPLPTQAMGAVAYDQRAGHHRLFAGTGDNSFGGTAIQGAGLYYSDDDGTTWYHSTGIPDAIESFKIVPDPSDATGMRVYAAVSKGLFRSDDDGVSFHNLALPTTPPGYTVPDPTQGGQQVSCAGNTTAPLCFFASIVTDVVVKKSASANAPAGAVMAVVGWRAGNRIDLNPDGTNNTTCRLSGSPTDCRQAPRNGLYISNTGATGSFSFQSNTATPLQIGAGLTFAANSVVGRTTLGIADGPGQNNDAVYALVQDATKFAGCTDDPLDSSAASACLPDVQALGYATILDGAYATYDFGKSWTKIMNFTQLHVGGNSALVGQAGYSPGVQAWYNNWIKPDPTTKDSNGDPTRVLFGLEEIWENNITAYGTLPLHTPWLPYQGVSAASSWQVIGRYWNDCGGLNQTGGDICNPSLTNNPIAGTTTHPDQHASIFIPDGAGGVTLFVGNDGGAYKQHIAAGADFTNDRWGDGINTGLYTLQPYDAEVARDGTIVAGLQDNGEMKIAPGGKEAHTIYGGDGFMTTIDPNNSKNILEEYTYGVTSVSLNGGKDWYGVDPGCGSSSSLFSTALEQDPTIPGHVIEGCTQIKEAGGTAASTIYKNPCAFPPGGDPATCQLVSVPWKTVFNLGAAAGSPAHNNIPSAIGVRGEHTYVGYCGYCDVVTGGLPFNSGIATNVGGGAAPQIGSSAGWHFAKALCADCGTPNGLLPKRYITSIQLDPGDANTVYATLGGYGRRWIPPGAIGDQVTNVGTGHVFVSHDHGDHWSNISGNLPDVPANWVLVHGGQLVVATDIGVFTSADTGGQRWGVLGSGLPAATVFTLRLQPGNPDRMIAATFGRGVYQYCFSAACQAAAASPAGPVPLVPGVTSLPDTAAFAPLLLVVPSGLALALAAGVLAWRRRPPARS
jgi:hypothetical protein